MLQHLSAVTFISAGSLSRVLCLCWAARQSAPLAWEQVPGRNHSAGTAAVFKVLELGRWLSVHRFLGLLPVITWSCINCWFVQHIHTVAASAVMYSYSFQSILVNFYRLGDVFGCLQARTCIVCKAFHPTMSYGVYTWKGKQYLLLLFQILLPELQIWKFRNPG